jgi:hypothetical protein
MNRREAIQKVSWILGGTIIGSSIFLEYGCNSSTQQGSDFFDKSTTDLLNEIAETILPKTNTPGAKEAKVGEFMNVMVKDCYTKADQEIFKAGIQSLEKGCKEKTGKNFMDCSPEERTSYLTTLDSEQKAYTEKEVDRGSVTLFQNDEGINPFGLFYLGNWSNKGPEVC